MNINQVQICASRNLHYKKGTNQIAEKMVVPSLGFHHTDTELNSHFSNLPNDTQMNIFSRLPVVDILKCRVVCRDWKGLSSSSDSADSSRPGNFLKNFWIQNRPKERWVFLLNSSVLKKSLLYDVQNQVCYRWFPDSDLYRGGEFQVWNTTANGLLFLIDGLRFHPSTTCLRRLWACNLLTVCLTRLADISSDSGLTVAMVASGDTTTGLEHHYKVLLIQTVVDHVSLLAAEDHELKVQLYSSRDPEMANSGGHPCSSRV